MPRKEDWELEAPRDLKSVILDEVAEAKWVLHKRGEEVKPLRDEDIEALLQRIYAHIEKQALSVYNSNEPWALKSWAYDHILRDEVAKQAAIADESLLEELTAPVRDWQSEQFDPLLNLKRKLEAGEYAPASSSLVMRVAREFVLRYGKKQRYTEPEILDYLDYLRKTYRGSTYPTKVYQLKVFFDSLPPDELGRRQEMPLKRYPSYPTEYYQPTFSREELEAMAAVALIDEPAPSILRLLIAQVYGVRLGELATLDSRYINLDHGEPTITFLVQKRKSAKRYPVIQPIPKELAPFFSVPLKPRDPHQIISDLRRICRKAGLTLPPRAGIHAIRRRVVTDLWETPGIKELSIRNFIRWSTGSLGVMPRYVQKPTLQTDMQILKQHPYSWWKDWASYVSWLPQFKSATSVHIIDNHRLQRGLATYHR